MCPHGRHSLIGSDVSIYVSKIILDPPTQFHIRRPNLRTPPVTQCAFRDAPNLRQFPGTDKLATTAAIRNVRYNGVGLKWQDDAGWAWAGGILRKGLEPLNALLRAGYDCISHISPCS